MMAVNSEQAREEFKAWVKDFLSYHVDVRPNDVWTSDLITDTIATKYNNDMNFILENM